MAVRNASGHSGRDEQILDEVIKRALASNWRLAIGSWLEAEKLWLSADS
jgi:hypothetical protein